LKTNNKLKKKKGNDSKIYPIPKKILDNPPPTPPPPEALIDNYVLLELTISSKSKKVYKSKKNRSIYQTNPPTLLKNPFLWWCHKTLDPLPPKYWMINE